MPCPKNLKRPRLPRRREEARVGRAGNGSGRSFSDRTLPGEQLGARGEAGAPAPPVFPRGYGQTADVVPSGQRSSAGSRREEQRERGAASPWLKERLGEILKSLPPPRVLLSSPEENRAEWKSWQEGL